MTKTNNGLNKIVYFSSLEMQSGPRVGVVAWCIRGQSAFIFCSFILSKWFPLSRALRVIRQEEGEGGESKKLSFQRSQLLLRTTFLSRPRTARTGGLAVCWGCHRKIPHTGWCEQQKYISHSFGDWKHHGADRVGFILRFLLVVCRWRQLAVCSRHLFVQVRVGERLSCLSDSP